MALSELLGCCLLRYNHLEGLEDELNVIPERSMFYILQIEADLLLHNHVDIVILRILSLLHQLILIAKLDRSRIRNTWTHIQHMHLLRRPVVHVVTHLWTRPHQTHVPNEDINQLRQLIQLILADVIPRTRHARITPTNRHQRTLVAAYTHTAELEDTEIPVPAPHTHLAVKHRPLTVLLKSVLILFELN